MYQAPAETWNAIARTQRLRSQLGMDLFHLDAVTLTAALTALEVELERQGVDPKTIRGFVLVAPMLLENEAISQYVQDESSATLRWSLPELTSISEAVALATEEYRLNPQQQARLRKLLLARYPRPGDGKPSEQPKADR